MTSSGPKARMASSSRCRTIVETEVLVAGATRRVAKLSEAPGTITVVEAEPPTLFSFRWVYPDGQDAQDGNSLLSSVAMTVRYLYPDDWKERMAIFDEYLFDEV